MKKILFGRKGTNDHVPFWQPWGVMGCLGRLLLFLLMLTLLLVLLSLFRSCGDTDNEAGADGETWPREFKQPGDRFTDPGGEHGPVTDIPSDTTWNEPIADAEDVGLPSPEDNKLPPFDEGTTIPNPENGGATKIYPNLLYVIFDSGADDEVFKAFATKFTQLYPRPDNKIASYNTSSKTAVLCVPEAKRAEICQNLPSQISEVEFLVVPVEVMTQYGSSRSVTFNDPAFNYPDFSWQFGPIQAYEAWEITQGSEEIIVGIVDSFMDLNHEDLKGDRIVMPFSVPKANSDVFPVNGIPMESAGHGSLVTSIAVGTANNGKGSSGIAPKCKFIPVSMGSELNTITIVEGLLYCMYHGADVINLSCGSCFRDDYNPSIEEQIEFSQQYGLPQERMWDYVFKLAEDRGVVIVWSAGNENLFDAMDTSKRNGTTIRVSAVDRGLHKADFSNFGNFASRNIYESTISAPGQYIFGATPGNTYVAWDGTSFSAPIITGTVALMKSLNANLTVQQIIQILQETGKPVNGAPEIGKLVQIKDALLKVKDMLGNFDNDVNNLVGVWETTKKVRMIENNRDNGVRGTIRLTINRDGTAKVTFVEPGNVQYMAKAIIDTAADKMHVRQAEEARAANRNDYFIKHNFTLSADSDGKMKCHVETASGKKYDCYLYQVNS